MSSIKRNLKYIYEQIRLAEIANNRLIGSVRLLAVSKIKPAKQIAIAYRLGQRHFGESYLQEALLKQKQLASYNITWHFIGPIQSNKTKLIAENFSWVHSVDRLKIAKRLSDQRPAHLPNLNICLQINISEENTKSGINLSELPKLISEIESLPNIQLRGVMAIPEPKDDYQLQRKPYKLLVQSVNKLDNNLLDTFSFGMTGDLEAAIAEGSTIVRIGTALFGARSYQPD